ncbi:MAG: hypothetical protein JWP59_3429 [Massilia sp.]|nr:hypothetical protein [Massilia sp.]
MVATNFGIATADIIDGDIGYLDLRVFYRARLAAPALTAAMTRLAAQP